MRYLITFLLVMTCYSSAQSAEDPYFWYKGNFHTHSFWSDGDEFPEMVAAWYKDRGYNFLGISEHNVLSLSTNTWVVKQTRVATAFPAYLARFGYPWVEERTNANGTQSVRLKALSEFRTLFDEPGQFLLIQSEEITNKAPVGTGTKPVHLTAFNLQTLIAAQTGTSVTDVAQKSIDAVAAQSTATGLPMIAVVNHPNYELGVKSSDMIPLVSNKFFEVYNGHSRANNRGNSLNPSTDQIWDAVLAARLAQPEGEILYGAGSDDAHNYQAFGAGKANPGRGWCMVRSQYLTADALIAAMEAGDFYASTGVTLTDFGRDATGVWVNIQADAGVTYTTEFIGSTATAVGVVLATSTDLNPRYDFVGGELYVRAKVKSSRSHPNPAESGEKETAWTQPVKP